MGLLHHFLSILDLGSVLREGGVLGQHSDFSCQLFVLGSLEFFLSSVFLRCLRFYFIVLLELVHGLCGLIVNIKFSFCLRFLFWLLRKYRLMLGNAWVSVLSCSRFLLLIWICSVDCWKREWAWLFYSVWNALVPLAHRVWNVIWAVLIRFWWWVIRAHQILLLYVSRLLRRRWVFHILFGQLNFVNWAILLDILVMVVSLLDLRVASPLFLKFLEPFLVMSHPR